MTMLIPHFHPSPTFLAMQSPSTWHTVSENDRLDLIAKINTNLKKENSGLTTRLDGGLSTFYDVVTKIKLVFRANMSIPLGK